MKIQYKKPKDKNIYTKLGIEESYSKNIIMYDETIKHIKDRHMVEFGDEEQTNNAIGCIQKIISNPDFTYKVNNNTIKFFKKIGFNLCLVIEVKIGKDLKIKTLYPMKENKYKKMKLMAILQQVDNFIDSE